MSLGLEVVPLFVSQKLRALVHVWVGVVLRTQVTWRDGDTRAVSSHYHIHGLLHGTQVTKVTLFIICNLVLVSSHRQRALRLPYGTCKYQTHWIKRKEARHWGSKTSVTSRKGYKRLMIMIISRAGMVEWLSARCCGTVGCGFEPRPRP